MNILKSTSDAIDLLNDFKNSPVEQQNFIKSLQAMIDSLASKNKIMICGNGGSMCDAMHFAEELTGRFCLDRPPMRAVAFNDPGHITCTANDYGFEFIFSRMVESLGNPGDILICLSTSGNSPNILRALEAAKKMDIKVIGLTGKNGGELKQIADFNMHVQNNFPERIQEIHMFWLHCFAQELERHFFPNLYQNSDTNPAVHGI